jgi:hypothetical protein
VSSCLMTDLFRLILAVLPSLFKSPAELDAENLVLRQQINVLRQRMAKRRSSLSNTASRQDQLDGLE